LDGIHRGPPWAFRGGASGNLRTTRVDRRATGRDSAEGGRAVAMVAAGPRPLHRMPAILNQSQNSENAKKWALARLRCARRSFPQPRVATGCGRGSTTHATSSCDGRDEAESAKIGIGQAPDEVWRIVTPIRATKTTVRRRLGGISDRPICPFGDAIPRKLRPYYWNTRTLKVCSCGRTQSIPGPGLKTLQSRWD